MATLTLRRRRGEPHPRPRGRWHTGERYLLLTSGTAEGTPDDGPLVVAGALADAAHEPSQIAVVELPALGRDGRQDVGATDGGAERIADVRAQLALAIATAYDPDVIVVDSLPHALDRQLLPALRALRRLGRCPVVVRLRDIDGDPALARHRRVADRLRTVLRQTDDRVLAQGAGSGPEVLDCLDWSAAQPSVPDVGYHLPVPGRALGVLPEGNLRVTTGGGAAGYALAVAVLQALAARALRVPVVLVAGPLVPEAGEVHRRPGRRASRLSGRR